MVTGHASVTLAVDAMKAGSMDLLTKPVTLQSLKDVVDRALAERGERRALDYYLQRDARHASLDALVGNSPAMHSLRELIRAVSGIEPTDNSPAAPILVLGETGTGKELVARACHQTGARAKAPFIEINCAALPGHLIEGELFGFEKGAFTDAHARKIGLIEAADGGTLFLDEIGELDLPLQAKLLRVLENLRVRRIGALSDRQVNVRIVAATNRDLDEQVREGRFRADLMYRLKVFQIHIPPLRARAEDIPVLAHHFLAQLASRYGRDKLDIDSTALAALAAHDWPGNVRELRNVLERAVLLQRTGTLGIKDLILGSPRRQAPTTAALPAPVEPQSLDALEREHVQRALAQCAGNVSKAAKLLGISRDTLRYRMERHGLQR
jgi:DNA-binding NtrC family response regulator